MQPARSKCLDVFYKKYKCNREFRKCNRTFSYTLNKEKDTVKIFSVSQA